MVEQTAVTEDGKKVLLREDKTWEYIEDVPKSTIPPLKKKAPIPAEKVTAKKPTQPPPPSAQESGEQSRSSFILILFVSAGFILIIGIILLYFLVFLPGKKRKQMIKAFEIIESDRESEFSVAEEILDKAIVSGLKAKDISDACFALAYVKARLKKYKEAAVELTKTKKSDPETLFLSIWLKVKLEDYKEAYELYMKHSDIFLKSKKTRELASIACLHLGREQWKNREIEAAIHYFDQVRKLGIHLDKIPETIGTHQVTLGILSLFDKHIDEAEGHFKGALEQAAKENTSDMAAELGLLLCEWKRKDYPDIDDRLAVIEKKLKMDIPIKPPPKVKPEEKKEKDELEIKKTKLSEDSLLLRNTYLWFAVSRIFTWFQRKENSGLPDEERKILKDRLEQVLTVDPEMGDPLFIMGLIDYFFAYDKERERAVENIEKSGIKVPEAKMIVSKEKKLLEFEKNSLEQFFALAKKYLANKAIPLIYRKKVIEKLEAVSTRFKSFSDEMSIGEEDDEVVATLKDIQARGEILNKRINNLMKTKLKEADPEVEKRYKDLMEEMDKTTKILTETTEHLETTEQEIMINTGEFLLGEEEKREKPKDEKEERDSGDSLI
jgi:tetratricopeptide (TPR) repeat protein